MTARLRDPVGDVYAQAADISMTDREGNADIVRQRVALPVPYEAPPGDYVLEMALPRRGAVVQPAVSPDSDNAGAWVRLQLVRVHPSFQVPGRAPEQVESGRRLSVTEELRIFDYRLPSGALRPGSRLDLDVLWQARATPSRDVMVRFELRDAQASLLGEVTTPLGGTAYPTSRWRPVEVIRGQYHLPVTQSASGGSAALWASLVSGSGESPVARVQLGSVEIRERPRRFEAPAIGQPVGISIPEVGMLLGYSVEGMADPARPSHWSRGAEPAVTLFWKAAGPTRAGYKVSLQLVSQAGVVGVQHDGLPDGGEAPTTTWTPGEIITDRHPLLLPAGMAAGRYRLLVIVYHEASGQRLAFAGVGDALQLDEITIS